MLKELLRFIFIFLVVVVGGYFIHMGMVTSFSLDRNQGIINFSYVFNGIFTLLFVIGILVFSNKFKDQIGFIFMGGSLVKIGLFIGISKLNNMDIDKNVFLDFFVAYLICLILEVYFVSRILKSVN
ncbi:DUF6168 family protein [Aquimarina spongiae]|uniref:Uncharacterized protein n=1 Tax=Aquimarina spongiae TaxID=570521 RepID=A0A1M6F899_9FLAO|nr:DUF6168 family protein [Aquimarina spongiae]SHI93948.1 hypothetical protein SAMN04488508_104144 [Aquimarina spongiae]